MVTLPAQVEPGQIPQGYHEVLYWKITGQPMRMIVLQVVSIPLFIASLLVFYGLAAWLGRLPLSGHISLLQGIGLLIGLPFVLVLHELVHGLVMRYFGAHPRYGVMWKQLMFYATSPGYAFPRRRYLYVALAPLVVISVLAVLAMLPLAGTTWVGLWALLASVNAAGAIGDLWISLVVLRYPPRAYVIDERDGMRIYLPLE